MKVRWLVAFLLAAFTGVAAAQQGQVPTTETALGSVRIPRSVKADGKELKAGTYQVRLTAQAAAPAVPGQTDGALGRVRAGRQGRRARSRQHRAGGRSEGPAAGSGLPGKAPSAGSKVEMLKGNEYLRVWINRAGVSYLIHMPPA